MTRRVTLLTDFGTRDGYVALVKGVTATLAPNTLLDDASHDVPQGDVRSASWALGRYWRLGEGALVAVVNSDGLVEVAERNGSAAETLGVGTGTPVSVVLPDP